MVAGFFFEEGLDIGGDGCELVLGNVFSEGRLMGFDFLDDVGGVGELGCYVLAYFC